MNLKLSLSFALLITTPLVFAGTHTGTILETMNSGGYTYARIMENKKEYWIAGSNTAVKVGDTVSFGEQMTMPDFTSKTLNRTFKELMFVGGLSKGSVANVTLSSMHGNAVSKPKADIDLSNITKAKGGYTIDELYKRKAELKGASVKVHGRVVKVNNGIMGTNWIHIQDGTGTKGSNDILFRAKTATANVGDLVLATGKLVTDKDFGSGYQYPVLVEDAAFELSK